MNAERLRKKFKDETAAKKKRGSELKQPLTMSPFVLEFDYGASAEGYWTYDSMVLNRKLNVGNVQSMVFRSTVDGPYWMTPDEQQQTRKDH